MMVRKWEAHSPLGHVRLGVCVERRVKRPGGGRDEDEPGIKSCEKMYVREQRRLLVLRRFVGKFSHGRMQEAPGCAAKFCSVDRLALNPLSHSTIHEVSAGADVCRATERSALTSRSHSLFCPLSCRP